MVAGKIKWRLSEVNTRAVSRGQDELIGKFKMVASDVISIRRQAMEYTYMRLGMDCNQKGYFIDLMGWSLLPNALRSFELPHLLFLS